jgi:formylglycine-generating enzyme required for sulfatase activity
MLLKAGATSFALFLLIAAFSGDVLAQTNPGAEQLYQQWSDNRQTDSKIAYESAREYLKQFPDGKYAKLLKAWNAAYEKVMNQTVAPPVVGVPTLPPSRDGAAMVSVPAGEFWMGSDDGSIDERPLRRVYLDFFRIDTYEVTNAMFRRFIAATGWPAPRSGTDFNGSEQPVWVDWNAAAEYCKWAGKRLPTEAEWEKAARGTDGRKYPWGNEWGSNPANYDGSRIGKTTPVGSFPSGISPYGSYDMMGNASEWVQDWYDENYYSGAPTRNPTGPVNGRYHVVRGGYYNQTRGFLRSSARAWDVFGSNGFRCAQ